jgi:NitT/TauT family transport system substrate-binding protein
MKKQGSRRRLFLSAMASAAIAFACCTQASAEATEVKISYQYGLGFFPVTVVLNHHLIEKHAKAQGLADVKASGVQLSGAAMANDALLSESIDIASGGVGGLLQMWDKTGGQIGGLISLNNMSFLLNTNDPNVRTLKDYLKAKNHKIALPAVKIGLHAIVLSIAAGQEFGADKADILDAMTVSLRHPDAYTAIKGGHSEIKSHFASLPFSYMEKKLPSVHTVITSYDVMGGPHNNTLLYTSEKWIKNNPKLAQAVFDAFVEAEKWIETNPAEAAKLFKTATKSALDLEDIEKILKDRSLIGYSPEPIATMKFAEFTYKQGRIKKMPKSWKDFFWPIAHTLTGS